MDDHLLLQSDPIEIADVVRRVADRGCGAIATFSGTVRDSFEDRRVLFLEYEAYDAMARRVLEEIATELRRRHAIARLAIVHRTGRLDVGETSVAIAVSAPHRAAALAACAEGIESLKARLPIWKKEHFEGGEVWRENSPRPGVPSAR